jgi:hypothetical protein
MIESLMLVFIIISLISILYTLSSHILYNIYRFILNKYKKEM